MINLLPDEQKREIRAARTNVLLVRYVSMLASGVLLLTLLLGGTFFVLNTSRENAQKRVDETHTKMAGYSTTKVAAEEFRSNVATAKKILDNELTYSNLIYKVADAVPSNVVLDSLDLDSQTIGSKATMSASARTYNDAVRLKNAFAKNGTLFSDVHFESVTESETTGEPSAYPVKVELSLVIKKDAL